MDSNIEVSVLVLTYNPQVDKLTRTLESIILQEKINCEIVISDDGSIDNCFAEAEEIFKKYEFKKYRLINNRINRGTVQNVYSGLKKCCGEYIKLISPGDFFVNRLTLYEWIKFIKNEGTELSFSNVYYYRINSNKIELLKEPCHPQRQDIYKTNNIEKIKKYYLLVEDIALGAAVLCKRDIMEKYLPLLIGKIKYAEDNVYKIMLADNIRPSFYDECTLFYECGSGISTNKNSKWLSILKDETFNTNLILLSYIKDNKMRKKLMVVNELKRNNTMLNKVYAAVMVKEKILHKIKKVKYSRNICPDDSLINLLYGK